MLKVTNLKQAFGENVILNDVSFSLEAGEIIGLVAPNGTGKSTLLHILMNFLRPNSGEVIIKKEEMIYDYRTEKNEVEMHKRISFLPELDHLYMDLTGRDHLNYYARLWTGSTDIVNQVIKGLDISSYVDTKVRTYSLGMRQRLAFAMVLVTDTPIMLMDEVMNGLDPDNVDLITNVLIELKEKKKTIIIASHLLANLDVYADRVMFIKDGKIIFKSQKETNDWSEQYMKVTLTAEQVQTFEANNSLPKTAKKMSNDQWVIPLKNLSKEEVNDLFALFLKDDIYDFTIAKIGTQEWYDYYYGK